MIDVLWFLTVFEEGGWWKKQLRRLKCTQWWLLMWNSTHKLMLTFYSTFCRNMRCWSNFFGWGGVMTGNLFSPPRWVQEKLMNGQKSEMSEQTKLRATPMRLDGSRTTVPHKTKHQRLILHAEISPTSSKMADKKWMLNSCFQVQWNP